MANKVYEIITQRIIQKIEEAIKNNDLLPWQKPWVYASAPQNYITGKKYNGINTLLLEPGEYITWTQICDLKKQNPELKLKKGCKKEIVVYFNFTEHDNEKSDNNGNTITEKQKVPFLRYYNVYHIRHVDGLESKIQEESFQHDPIEKAQQIIDDYVIRENIKVAFEKGDRACYSPLTDSITLPVISQYPVVEEFYSTAFHELGHSTGASNRLNRNIKNMFGSTSYSKEKHVFMCRDGQCHDFRALWHSNYHNRKKQFCLYAKLDKGIERQCIINRFCFITSTKGSRFYSWLKK